MKIALAQINPVVGDVIGNTEKIIGRIEQARAEGASLVVLPELAVAGYPPWDLLLKPRFVQANVEAVRRIAEHCRGVAALIGFVEPNIDPVGRSLRNAAAYCADGRVQAVRYKSLLPTYDVYDERRYFEPGPEVAIVDHGGLPVGVTICEDLWNDEQLVSRRLYRADPISQLAEAGAKLIVNLSASPFTHEKHPYRVRLFGNQARRYGLPLLFTNQVGGNDELVFDGASGACDARGKLIAQAKAFEEDLLVVDLDAPEANRVEPYPESIVAIHDVLALGIRDYVRKCGFQRVVLGLSGGIDSAVVAALAVAGLGREAVTGVSMPSRFSSEHSKTDAEVLARNLGIDYRVIPIKEMHESVEGHLRPQFAGRPPDTTEENLQARLRGMLLMALSNKFGWLVLTTGNKSELAVGYCTLYGDMCGGLAPLGDVPKMMVYALARHINQRAGREIIPENTIVKPPSAELRPDQTDQDSLPPYEVLDQIVELYINEEKSQDEIIEAGFDADVVRKVIRLIDVSEYKRKQAAPVLKVTSRAFGIGRRMPIAARFRY
ncbi:MAG: NAD+ synthase [Phycisphaerae bacterium]